MVGTGLVRLRFGAISIGGPGVGLAYVIRLILITLARSAFAEIAYGFAQGVADLRQPRRAENEQYYQEDK